MRVKSSLIFLIPDEGDKRSRNSPEGTVLMVTARKTKNAELQGMSGQQIPALKNKKKEEG